MIRSGRPVLLATGLVLALAGAAWADAVVERTMRSDGLGGIGAFEGASTETTSGVAQRDESTFRFTGGFLSAIQRMAGSSGDSIRITRVDQGVVWILEPEKKTYTEAPLGKIQGYWISTQVEWSAEGEDASARGGESASPRPDDVGAALGRLFGGGGGSRSAESPRDGRRPLFSLQTEVKSLRVMPADPGRFEVPAGYTLKR